MLRINIRNWSFQRKKSRIRHFKHTWFAMLLTYLQKVSSKKTNKKQFKIQDKDEYVTPDQIFEVFVGIADGLTMNDDKYLQLNERSKM